VRALGAKQEQNKQPWEALIKKGIAKLGDQWKRPGSATDVVQDKPAPASGVQHPEDSERRNGQPRVFHGPIASANKLLRNPDKRDALRDEFGVKAVEMEGSGVADATWNLDKGYLVVRGTCDYCNPAKGDAWHRYAALAAAAYTRCVIEQLAPTKKVKPASERKSKPSRKQPAKQPKDVKRERDVEQLRRVFYWLNPRVFDQFIDRLGFGRITFICLNLFEGFERVVTSHSFHLYDTKLKEHIQMLYQKWRICFRYTSIMDASFEANISRLTHQIPAQKR